MFDMFMEAFDGKNYVGVMDALVRVAAIQVTIRILFCSIAVIGLAIVPMVVALVCFIVRDEINEEDKREA